MSFESGQNLHIAGMTGRFQVKYAKYSNFYTVPKLPHRFKPNLHKEKDQKMLFEDGPITSLSQQDKATDAHDRHLEPQRCAIAKMTARCALYECPEIF